VEDAEERRRGAVGAGAGGLERGVAGIVDGDGQLRRGLADDVRRPVSG